ncbi:MAG: recombination mediator RecR [Thermoanaerobaculales bacterium]|jgi:recombination protein RecR|nr:recombination mediator RecR [Thermoanaerobaculales bacterium]
MDLRPASVKVLLEHLGRLPGVGPRTARSLAEHLLTTDPAEVAALAAALDGLHERLRLCSICSMLTQEDPCPVCSDPDRDRSTILVVEAPTTVWAVEDTRQYRGLYHALLGHLSPLHGVGPEDLTIGALVERCRAGGIEEVILATDPTVEGETTAVFIARQLQDLPVAVTRPASGIPVGGELASVDQLTLAQALQSRRKV